MEDREFRALVERVKLRSPIEVVVGERVADLRPKGSRLWARCPFHEEKTPSFCVDPERGTWYCFGACGEGGDVLTFVERFDGVDFKDALRLLGQSCGEEVPERFGSPKGGPSQEGRRERLHDVLARAGRLYQKLLGTPDGREALSYLRGRGFGEETLRTFGVGWAPSHGSPVLESATAAGFSQELLIEAGLVKHGADGRAYDFFRGRLMIPIRDRLGRTMGFGGRRLPGDEREGGKYVNTGETTLFKKSHLIFGLDVARDEVRRTRRLVLMEGYTDVMAAHQAGVGNAAAVLGTATTGEHAALVRRIGARRVTLVFDGDEAGRRAVGRALFGLLPIGVAVDVVALPAGKDPGDLCLDEGGGEVFRGLLDGARDWLAEALDGLEDRSAPELAQGVGRQLELLGRIASPVEREARMAEMAGTLGLSEEALRGEAARLLRPPRISRGEGRPEPPDRPKDPEEAAVGALIGASLLDNSLIPVLAVHAGRASGDDLGQLSRVILELHEKGDEEVPIDASAVLTALGDHPARNLVASLVERARTAESPQSLARDQIAWFERRDREEAICARRQEVSRTSGLGLEDPDARDALRRLHRELRGSKLPKLPTPHPTASSSQVTKDPI